MKRPIQIRYSLVLAAFFYFALSLFSQSLPSTSPESVGLSSERLERLTEKFQAYVDEDKMAGSVILIARKGKVAYFESIGMSDIKSKSKMEKDAIFRIASQTKAIVSVGIMILQEQGKLLISDKVGNYIPEFAETTVAEPKPQGGYQVVEAKRTITIRDLLTHTAGIDYGYGLAAEEWKSAGIQGWYFAHLDEPIAETIPRMAALPMVTHPGTKWVYGYNTDILGLVIEEVSGKSLDLFIKDEILDPLDMKDTHFYLPKDKADRLATVYNPRGDKLEPSPKDGTMDSQGAYIKGPRKSFSGGAGLLSTTTDYYLFLQMLANGGELNGTRIISPKTVELMTVDHLNGITFRDGQGFGLGFSVVNDIGAHGTYGSIGSFGWGGAYGSTYWVDPKEELVVVYFTQVRPGSAVSDQSTLRALIYQAMVN